MTATATKPRKITYHLDALNDINIEDVISALNIHMDKNKTFPCINPNHYDKNPSMGINKKNNTCHCFSCGATYGPLQAYNVTHDLPLFPKDYDTLQQSCEGYASLMGIDLSSSVYSNSMYIEAQSGQKTDKSYKYIDQFPVSTADLSNIGYPHDSLTQVYVSAKDYCLSVYGEIPPNGPRVYRNDGKEALMTIPKKDAESYGLTYSLAAPQRQAYLMRTIDFYSAVYPAIPKQAFALKDANGNDSYIAVSSADAAFFGLPQDRLLSFDPSKTMLIKMKDIAFAMYPDMKQMPKEMAFLYDCNGNDILMAVSGMDLRKYSLSNDSLCIYNPDEVLTINKVALLWEYCSKLNNGDQLKACIERDIKNHCADSIAICREQLADIEMQLKEFSSFNEEYKQYLYDNYLSYRVKLCKMFTEEEAQRTFPNLTPTIDMSLLALYENYEKAAIEKGKIEDQLSAALECYSKVIEHEKERIIGKRKEKQSLYPAI